MNQPLHAPFTKRFGIPALTSAKIPKFNSR